MADVLQELTKVRHQIGDLEQRSLELIDEAREDGASWQAIGEALAMSRQAAWERFGKTE